MTLVDDFTVQVKVPSTNETSPVFRLFYQERDTGIDLPVAVLEASLAVEAGWLLFLTEDIPFEEGLQICLLGHHLELLDRASLTSFNSTGNFSDLCVISPRSVRFQFIGAGEWQLELLDKPGFRIPLVSEPLGVVRPLGFSRHFALSRILPQTTAGDSGPSR